MEKGVHIMNPKAKKKKSICHRTTFYFYIQYEFM